MASSKKTTQKSLSLVQRAKKQSTATNLRERQAINQSSGRDYQAWAARQQRG
jgi:hypothetical protein